MIHIFIFRNLRVVTYEVLILFLDTSKNNMFVKGVSENLLKEIFLDITPSSDEIRLTVIKFNQCYDWNLKCS